MRARSGQDTIGQVEARPADLVVRLEKAMPSTLPVGCAAAIFCLGHCFHPGADVQQLELIINGVRHRPAAFGMPRPDVAHGAYPGPAEGTDRSAPAGRTWTDDQRERSYRSGFWATIPTVAPTRPGRVELKLAARLAGGTEVLAHLGWLDVAEPSPAPALPGVPADAERDLIAICMATFEPDVDLLEVQIESLRSQTDSRWVCLVSDDCSRPDRFEQIQRVLGTDSRFVLSRSDTRLGFYRNFERAMEMVPGGIGLVALCDQDDRWHPDKLQVLRSALGGAQLVYSDQRLVDARGQVLRNTLWTGRRNNYRNLASQLTANTITGAAMLMRREVAQLALPFPDGPGFMFHDHWIGLVAMATGDIAFVDRPLYDYVQHRRAIFGDVSQGTEERVSVLNAARDRLSVMHWRGQLNRWRAAYFYGYLSREVQAQTLLVRGQAHLTPHKRRVLQRFVSSGRSPWAFAWLATRPLRLVFGFNETLGSEADLARGIAWRWLTAVRLMRPRKPGSANYDAGLPDPASFEQKRLRRWRASL